MRASEDPGKIEAFLVELSNMDNPSLSQQERVEKIMGIEGNVGRGVLLRFLLERNLPEQVMRGGTRMLMMEENPELRQGMAELVTLGGEYLTHQMERPQDLTGQRNVNYTKALDRILFYYGTVLEDGLENPVRRSVLESNLALDSLTVLGREFRNQRKT